MSMFTKKHYIWFATKIGDGTFDCSDESLVALLKEFKLDNPEFNSKTFIRVVGHEACHAETDKKYNEAQDHVINLKGEML